MSASTYQRDHFRLFFPLDYYYFCAFYANVSTKRFYKQNGAETATFFLLFAVLYSMACLFSTYVWDLNGWLISHYPWHSDVFKSPLNPKTAPATLSLSLAIPAMWVRYRTERVNRLLEALNLNGFVPHRWLALLFFLGSVLLTVFATDFPFLTFLGFCGLFAVIWVVGTFFKTGTSKSNKV